MDEEMKKDDISTAPEQPKTEEAPQEVEQHAEENEVATQPTSEAHVDEKESGTEQPDTTVPDYKVEFERLKSKQSQIEKERNEYLQAKQLVDALDAAASVDPEFMKLANKKLVEQGLLDESVLQTLDNNQVQTAPQQGQPQPVVDPAVAWARERMIEDKKKEQAEKQEKIKFFEEFESAHPNLLDGSEDIVKANRTAIGAVAARKMAQDNVPMKDAYEYAYKAVMDPASLVEEGKIQGLAQAQAGRPVEGAASGGSANSAGEVVLTPQQREIAKSFGISEEAYAKRLMEE